MKVKTSVTLDEDLLADLARVLPKIKNRSRAIEDAVRFFVQSWKRKIRDAKEIRLINRHAKSLNAEARDVALDQADL